MKIQSTFSRLFTIAACFLNMHPLFAQQVKQLPKATALEQEMIWEAEHNTLTEEALKKYLSDEHFNINAHHPEHRGSTTALIWAAINGNSELGTLLLRYGAHVDEQDEMGTTALTIAISHNDKKNKSRPFIELLLAHGADPNLHDTKLRNTPLIWATSKNATTLVKLLLATNKINLEAKNRFGLTALMVAKHPALTKLLIDHGADIDTRDIYGWTPLMRAAHNKKKKVILTLLEAGANPDIRGYDEEVIAAVATSVECEYDIDFFWEDDDKQQINRLANTTFYDLSHFYDLVGPLAQDPDIQKALADNKLRRQKQQQMLLETPLIKDLANIVLGYVPTPPSAEFLAQKDLEEKKTAESESEEED